MKAVILSYLEICFFSGVFFKWNQHICMACMGIQLLVEFVCMGIQLLVEFVANPMHVERSL